MFTPASRQQRRIFGPIGWSGRYFSGQSSGTYPPAEQVTFDHFIDGQNPGLVPVGCLRCFEQLGAHPWFGVQPGKARFSRYRMDEPHHRVCDGYHVVSRMDLAMIGGYDERNLGRQKLANLGHQTVTGRGRVRGPHGPGRRSRRIRSVRHR